MKRLCIIPCGAKKIWDIWPNAGATIAKDVYIGTFGKACQAYAARFFDNWVILSAKHGFLYPNDMIQENYDLAFDSKETAAIIKPDRLKAQLIEKGLTDFDEVVVLGGKKYRKVVEQIFEQNQLKYPLKGCKGIGYMIQKLHQAVADNQEIR